MPRLRQHRHDQRRSNTATTTWPDGVITRYLTIGGATIDILNAEWASMRSQVMARTVSAACTGCNSPIGEKTHRDWLAEDERPEVFDSALAALREAAQSHAETCRAMPKPVNDLT
jgi:hypothetical protein